MDTNTSVFEQTGRSIYGVFTIYGVILVAAVWSASPDGLAFRISSGYWQRSLLVAIPVGIFAAWKFQRALVGRSYKPRFGPERSFGLPESWVGGLVGSALLVFFAVCGLANLMNQVIGIPYTAQYAVTGKSVVQGKHTCYGLMLTNTDDPIEQLKICVSSSQQDATAIQDVLLISGRRSRYANQILSYVKRP